MQNVGFHFWMVILRIHRVPPYAEWYPGITYALQCAPNPARICHKTWMFLELIVIRNPREFVTKLEVFRTKSRANSPLHQSTLMDLNVAPKTQLEMEKVRAPTVQKTSELVSLSDFSVRAFRTAFALPNSLRIWTVRVLMGFRSFPAETRQVPKVRYGLCFCCIFRV